MSNTHTTQPLVGFLIVENLLTIYMLSKKSSGSKYNKCRFFQVEDKDEKPFEWKIDIQVFAYLNYFTHL